MLFKEIVDGRTHARTPDIEGSHTHAHFNEIFSLLCICLIYTTAIHMQKTLKGQNRQNKRAQRALGRSPEEKVKGHSGAIYRGPLMLSTKYW